MFLYRTMLRKGALDMTGNIIARLIATQGGRSTQSRRVHLQPLFG